MRKIFFVSAAFAALSTLANAQTASNVIIKSSGNNNYQAQVDSTGKLAVGPAAPTAFFHSSVLNLDSGGGCTQVAAVVRSGKKLDVQQVRINVYSVSTPGAGNAVVLYTAPDCGSGFIGDVNPPTVGPYTVTFGPGLIAPSGLYARVLGSPTADIMVDGFYIPADTAPSSNVTALNGSKPNQQKH